LIQYGTTENLIDVTDICLTRLKINDNITIPAGDANRARYFTDPVKGTLKKVFITINEKTHEYNDKVVIRINVKHNTPPFATTSEDSINTKLKKIHTKLNIKYGNLKQELPEQKMVVRYLTGNEKVLEIGANIGRNSLVIASILKNPNHLLTLECDDKIAAQLTENMKRNRLHFHIEKAALSERKLIQKGWNTIPSDVIRPGYKWTKTINFAQLQGKYNIQFDTLVLDCEGAFYYILKDMPEIINNVNLIIMENDYRDISHYQYVKETLTNSNFYVDYVEEGGWGVCKKIFFEVWKRVPTL